MCRKDCSFSVAGVTCLVKGVGEKSCYYYSHHHHLHPLASTGRKKTPFYSQNPNDACSPTCCCRQARNSCSTPQLYHTNSQAHFSSHTKPHLFPVSTSTPKLPVTTTALPHAPISLQQCAIKPGLSKTKKVSSSYTF